MCFSILSIVERGGKKRGKRKFCAVRGSRRCGMGIVRSPPHFTVLLSMKERLMKERDR